ncbi:hypothetical protein BJ508DRAFT_380753 [Ascobolus immersus RN42]|uniref:Uncharacterized protein n=1 Tax=Ascobolus immersus RN42 TaxID=1160509 RepID=A0A3N4HNN8_ASCIM|nr:hypothetical protein BJ508DRAFT_380753 [Ascobolus immersus RN42]
MPPIASQPGNSWKQPILKCSYCRDDKKKCETVLECQKCKRCVAKGLECSALTAKAAGRNRRNILEGFRPNRNTLVVPRTNGLQPCSAVVSIPAFNQTTRHSAPNRFREPISDGLIENSAQNRLLSHQKAWCLRIESARREGFRSQHALQNRPIDAETDQEFFKLLYDKLEQARMIRSQEPEKAEVFCRQIMHGALLAVHRTRLGELYADAVLLLVDLLVADGRYEEAISECSRFMLEDDTSWGGITKDKWREVEKVHDTILATERMGFLGTGLSLEKFISEFSPTVLQTDGDGSLLPCIISYYPEASLSDSLVRLLTRGLELKRMDIIESCFSLVRATPSLSAKLRNRLLKCCTAGDLLKRDSISWNSTFGNEIQPCVRRFACETLVAMIEKRESLGEIVDFLGEESPITIALRNDMELRDVLEAILEFQRADILGELLKRDLGPNILRCELFSLHSSKVPKRDCVRDVLRQWRNALADSSIPQMTQELTGGGITILHVVCWTRAPRAIILRLLLEWISVFPRAYPFQVRGGTPLDWHRRLLLLALIPGCDTTLKTVLTYLRRFQVQTPQPTNSLSEGSMRPPSRPGLRSNPFADKTPSGHRPHGYERSERVGEGSNIDCVVPASLYTWACITGVCNRSGDSSHRICRRPAFLPLHLAAVMGNKEATFLLLQHGANPAFLDNNNRTALFHAIVNPKHLNPALIQFLAAPFIYVGFVEVGLSVSVILTARLSLLDKTLLASKLEHLRRSDLLPESLVDCYPCGKPSGLDCVPSSAETQITTRTDTNLVTPQAQTASPTSNVRRGLAVQAQERPGSAQLSGIQGTAVSQPDSSSLSSDQEQYFNFDAFFASALQLPMSPELSGLRWPSSDIYNIGLAHLEGAGLDSV